MNQRTKEEEEKWREDWWLYVRDWIELTNDQLALCLGCAFRKAKLNVILKKSFFHRLTALTALTRTEYEDLAEQNVFDPSVYLLVSRPEEIYPDSVLNEACNLTAVETAAFLKSFHRVKWTKEHWEPSNEVFYGWGGIGPRLRYFQPEVVKEMISHFVDLGLPAHEGRAAWEKYEAARAGNTPPPPETQ
jgi:hypothetical protein